MERPRLYVCLFCGGEFESMPWFACCGVCYLGSERVRAAVDATHPQTWPSAVFDPGDSRVRGIDDLLDAGMVQA